MIFNKGRAKGMEDIFGGPSDVGMSLGMGPGVIGGPENGFGGRPASFNGGGFDAGRPSLEEKFRETNSNYNNSDQRELAAWTVATEKVKLAEVAEMFKGSGVNLT